MEVCPHCGKDLPKNVDMLKCKRCGHEWVPRTTSSPSVCPKCKSPYWDKDRQRKVSKLEISSPSLPELMERDEELASQGKGLK